MALWQYSFHLIPRFQLEDDLIATIVVDPTAHERVIGWTENAEIGRIEQALDKFLQRRASWSPFLTLWGDESSDEVQIFCKHDRAEVAVRLDVRAIKYSIIGNILEIAQDRKLVLIDETGVIFEPKVKILRTRLEQSSSFKFVTDPEAFLKSLSMLDSTDKN